jgi:5-(aminomethyl)-3-furanmethanol phosphate kinase
MSAPVVVKLGGSYAGSAEREKWLEAIGCCAGRVVLVPGGGPFADAVRTAQREMRFDDCTAHHMALLAMEQYGRALASLRPRWKLASSVEDIHSVLADSGVPVWAPAPMVLAAKDLPESWELTSDSLAAWLAGILGVSRLLLVKQVAGSKPSVPAADLVAKGVVDPLFPRFLGASGATAYIAGLADHAAAAAAIRNGSLPGSRIALP